LPVGASLHEGKPFGIGNATTTGCAQLWHLALDNLSALIPFPVSDFNLEAWS
jgi:hypothetical protein